MASSPPFPSSPSRAKAAGTSWNQRIPNKARSRRAVASEPGTYCPPSRIRGRELVPTRSPPRAVALSGQALPAPTPPPLLVVWRNAADRLPRRVLISGCDNDPIVIGSRPPWHKELLGCALLAPCSQIGSQLSLLLFGNEIQADVESWTTTASRECQHPVTRRPRPLKLTAGTHRVVSSSRHQAVIMLSCALDSQRAYLGKLRPSAPVSPLQGPGSAPLCTSKGHPGCVKNSAVCYWLPTLHAYRALLIGAALICTKRRRGPVLGQVRPTPSLQAFDVNSADCRPFPCRSRRARVKLPDQG